MKTNDDGSYNVEDLMKKTDDLRTITTIIQPDPNDPLIPESIFKYKAVTWLEPEDVWHTAIGSIPEDCIWTIGTTALESMQEFDKELKATLKDKDTIVMLPEKERRQLHKKVFEKIDRKLELNSHFSRN